MFGQIHEKVNQLFRDSNSNRRKLSGGRGPNCD
jgi:hypothetical protein